MDEWVGRWMANIYKAIYIKQGKARKNIQC